MIHYFTAVLFLHLFPPIWPSGWPCMHYYCRWFHCVVFFCTTHTHPFNSPFSGTTRVSWYQKGNTNLDFTEARDCEWQWHQLGRIQVCISLQIYNHASTHHSVFLQAGWPSCRPSCPTNIVKALKAIYMISLYCIFYTSELFFWNSCTFAPASCPCTASCVTVCGTRGQAVVVSQKGKRLKVKCAMTSVGGVLIFRS